MRIALFLAASVLSGCATRPMSQEERDSSDRTIRALEVLNASPWSAGARQPVQQRSPVAFFKRSYFSGMNQICVYQDVNGERVITIGAGQVCPASL